MSKYVTWSTPAQAHENKKIEVVIRIDFIIPNEIRKDFRRTLPSLLPAVEEKWSKGQRFKCYDFDLKIDWQWAESRADVRHDALDVLVFEGAGYGQIASDGPDQDRALSEDPEDVVTPVRGSDGRPSFVPLSVSVISHEVGHILGLEEGYVTDSWFFGLFGSGKRSPTKGHPPDVMQDPPNPVLPSTITRVVRRHYGPDFEKQMDCPLAMKVGPAKLDLFLMSLDDLTVEASAERYDPPSDDPAVDPEPARFTGMFHVAGEYLTRLPEFPWAAAGDATVPMSFEIDLGHDPVELQIDLGFWLLTQTLHWDRDSGLPYAEGPLLITVDGGSIDSSMFWPGPPLLPEFYDPARGET